MQQTRVKKLFDIICESKDYCTAEVLAKKLEVSQKTVRNTIKELKNLFQGHGAEIYSKAGQGYSFVVADRKKYAKFLKNDWQKFSLSDDMNLRENRIHCLLKILLERKDFVREDDLADGLAVSRSQISQDLKEIRIRLQRFHLNIEIRPYHGLRITGAELDFRRMLSCYFFPEEMGKEYCIGDDGKEKIQQILEDAFREGHYRMTENAYDNLVGHILFSLQRIKAGEPIIFCREVQEQMQSNPEYHLAAEIADHLEKYFSISMDISEVVYIAMHLSGKRFYEKVVGQELQILPEIDVLVCKILQQIKSSFQVDFNKDFDLRISLGLHMMVLVNRIHYQLYLKNPLREATKRYALAFEMGVMAAEKIGDIYHCALNEDEIAYLALHFNVALERLKSKIKRKRILLVCSTGRGTAQLLKYRFQEEFSKYVAELKAIDMRSLSAELEEEYDFIVSTVPLTVPTKIPVLILQALMSEVDLKQIRNTLEKENSFDMVPFFSKSLFFTDISGETRQEVLHALCNRICQIRSLPTDGFYDSVWRRESQSSTDYEWLVAVPHPDRPQTEQSFAAIAILPKPVWWQRQKVQVVLLFHMGKTETMELQVFYQKLWSFLTAREQIKRVIKEKDYDAFLDIIHQM